MPRGECLPEWNRLRRLSLIGQKFNKLTIIEEDGHVGKSYAYKCKCECGTIREKVKWSELKRGKTKSCGCDYPKGHCKPGKTTEQYHEHVRKELLCRINIVGECWEYIGQIDHNGYGRKTFGQGLEKRKRPVNQIAYILWKGEISEGKFICHTCDNRKCFNPDHLWVGTCKENLDDMRKKGRANRPKGEDHHDSKLTEKDVIEIRKLRKMERTLVELGKIYKVNPKTIESICKFKKWKHVKEVE